jgi:hypothetical protein
LVGRHHDHVAKNAGALKRQYRLCVRAKLIKTTFQQLAHQPHGRVEHVQLFGPQLRQVSHPLPCTVKLSTNAGRTIAVAVVIGGDGENLAERLACKGRIDAHREGFFPDPAFAQSFHC